MRDAILQNLAIIDPQLADIILLQKMQHNGPARRGNTKQIKGQFDKLLETFKNNLESLI
jgi:hypothetical protein